MRHSGSPPCEWEIVLHCENGRYESGGDNLSYIHKKWMDLVDLVDLKKGHFHINAEHTMKRSDEINNQSIIRQDMIHHK